MTNPDAPYLEMGLYRPGCPGQSSLTALISFLTRRKSYEVRGRVIFTRQDATRDGIEFRVGTLPQHHQQVDSTPEFERLARNAGVCLIQVPMESASSIIPNRREIAVLDSDSPTVGGEVSLWIDGSIFCHRPGSVTTEEYSAGERATALFFELIAEFRPSYATLSLDHGIKSPSQLRGKPDGYLFANCYVSRACLGGDFTSALHRLMRSGAFVDEMHDGAYLSTFGPLNRDHREPTADVRHRMSEEISEILTRSLHDA